MNEKKIEGIALNLDDSRFLWPNAYRAKEMTIEDAYIYIDQYIGGDSHVTDLVLTVNTAFMSMFDSEVWEDQQDKYEATEDGGKPADYKSAQPAVMHRYSKELGVDVWKLWIDYLWKKGVNPWLSYRMADHHSHLSRSPLTGDFLWDNMDKYARVLHRDNATYRGDRCFDFCFEEVRNKWLAYIEESITKYDVYGIELDWMRDPIFTTLGNEWAASGMLTQFIRDIKAIVTKREAVWGHKILISVRCARDIQSCIDAGFEITKWCAEGLIDWVCPSAYFVTDTEIPVLTWKNILAPYNVKLVPNITQGMFTTIEGSRTGTDIAYYAQTPGGAMNLELIAGTAYSYLAQGADKLYIFNIFGDCGHPITEADKRPTDRIYPLSMTGSEEDRPTFWKLFCTAGSGEKMAGERRRYTLGYQDYAGLWGAHQSQLPLVIDRAYKYRYIHFYTGDVKNDKLTLMLGVDDERDVSAAMEVFVNGKLAKFVSREKYPFPYLKPSAWAYCFDVDASVINGSAVVEFTTKDKEIPYTVVFGEILAEPKN